MAVKTSRTEPNTEGEIAVGYSSLPIGLLIIEVEFGMNTSGQTAHNIYPNIC